MRARIESYTEGKTRLLVPSVSLSNPVPPTSPVFFNPAASLNRDVSVSVAVANGTETFCDAMSGVGARGLRLAVESGVGRVVLVDFNDEAMTLAKRGARLNRVGSKCEFAVSETSSYLHSRFGRTEKFDCVDVDPFGSPVRQVDAALGAVRNGGVVSFTATDAAVLCGVYPRVCLRRYGAVPLNNAFGHETAVRILLGHVVRQAASQDIGATPLFAHSTRHYLRVYLTVKTGATKADACLKQIGFISVCTRCGNTSSGAEGQRVCDECEGKSRSSGPLWLGKLAEDTMLRGAVRSATGLGLVSAARLMESTVGVDRFPPWSFSIEEACSRLGVATAPEQKVRENLATVGRESMRQPFETRGMKTDASVKEFVEAVREAA